jgi:natural product biosynthesis luciferase-like monooxygenase protein
MIFENYAVKELESEGALNTKSEEGLSIESVEVFERTNYDFNVIVHPASTFISIDIKYNLNSYDQSSLKNLIRHFDKLTNEFVRDADQSLRTIDYLSEEEKHKLLVTFNDTAAAYPKDKTIVDLFEEQAAKTPDNIAVVFEDRELTYRELNEKSNQLARYLRDNYDIQPDDLVGIKQERSEWMIVSILGVLKSGGAYVPVDPAYPQERVQAIVEDSKCKVLLGIEELTRFQKSQGEYSVEQVRTAAESNNLAYVIYTSGSTGRPKGVMIEHRNLTNFFSGMTTIFGEEKGTFLSMTNFTFDISVLELLWTLSKGYKVVIQGEARQISDEDKINKKLDFSLFYFGNDEEGEDKYKLLMDGAKYADENDYLAVWTPERHFNKFGGLYPNPTLMAAALSSVTKNIGIRAGSVVLPLHHSIRLAEDWSVIDNLSKGRVGIACASGWHANDFVLAPDKYGQRYKVMYESIDTLRKLWKGESVEFENGIGNFKKTKIFPKPIQDEIPVWITAAGNKETFISAGKIGANILTHMLGNSIEELADKIAAYRKAFTESDHDVKKSKVTLMLHTYIDDEDNIEKKARQPFIDYIKSSAGLIQQLIPNFDQNTDIAPSDLDALYEHAYKRFVSTSSLVGTKETCYKMLQTLSAIGVDEIASLIDFGVDYNSAMQSLKRLTELKNEYNARQSNYSVYSQVKKHKVTHLQITPSMGAMLNQYLSEDAGWDSIKNILLGGEPATASLVNDIYEKLPHAQLYNMYGPTETTIWSTVKTLEKNIVNIEIGKPIANTKIYILDENRNPAAAGVQGEIYIGGEGVARGYTNKALTDLSFIESPFVPGDRLYRTGDFGSWLNHGSLYCFGRKDQQVKIRGYRIELGEIEQALLKNKLISEAVVLVKGNEEKLLVAYIISKEQQNISELRLILKELLPHYMIPNHFVQLEELPLNANGKIDKRLLPDPEGMGLSKGVKYVAPRNEIEKRLVKIWEELLQIDHIGVFDDFFALGGHSLKATQLIIRVKEIFGIKIDLRNLLSKPNIDSLSQEISTLKWVQDKSEEIIVEGDELII